MSVNVFYPSFADDNNLFNHGTDLFVIECEFNTKFDAICGWLTVNK